MRTTAILGYPGAGKTYAVASLIKRLTEDMKLDRKANRCGLVEYEDFGDIVIIGKYDGSKFQGTDRLSMAVAPDFFKFFKEMSERGVKHIVGEGDRINNIVFFRSAMDHGQLTRVKCDPDHYETLLKQREQRNHQFSQTFLKTVTSKVNKHNFDLVMNSNNLIDYLTKTVIT